MYSQAIANVSAAAFAAPAAKAGKKVTARSAAKPLRRVATRAVAEPEVEAADSARPVYPFSAIIGQEEMKFAAIMNIIDPNIGGIMVMGDRGTGKSTTVRALVDLLPLIDIVKDDAFMSSPTDPNLMAPEVLAKYKAGEDLETTKVPINMVDLPLDSAASGWNTVEREGISICHPARFILIGSGNPEEGELRPQLLDRFGMHAQIRTVKLPEERVKVVEERTAFDSDPKTFRSKYAQEQGDIIAQLTAARELLPQVEVPMEIRLKISQVCAELDIDGLRGDLVTTRAARAAAAYRGGTEVTDEDVYSVVTLCLPHRLRKDPMATIDEGTKVQEVFSRVFGYDEEE